jgi:hypothetical protein
MELLLFRCLIAAHIAAGATAAVSFWIPVIGRKGGVDHKRWGRLFTRCMLATGALACAMSLLTLAAPMATGSGSQLARTSCAVIRQRKAKAIRWNRFETKIATSSAILSPSNLFDGSERKKRAARNRPADHTPLTGKSFVRELNRAS